MQCCDLTSELISSGLNGEVGMQRSTQTVHMCSIVCELVVAIQYNDCRVVSVSEQSEANDRVPLSPCLVNK